MMRLADYVMRFISEKGVRHVFLLPGGGCMHLVDALGHNSQLKYICNLNEQAVSIAAEAYGQYAGFGVGLVTTGPGGTNAITGVAAAYIESTACMIISGQVKREDLIGDSGLRQRGMQEIDIVSIVKPITKYAHTILDPESIRYHLEKAFYLATNLRPGPVWLDIPLDVQAAIIDETQLAGFVPPESGLGVRSDITKEVNQTINLLTKAKRPCILVGNGVRLAHAEHDVARLIEMTGIPALATWKVIDLFDEEEPQYFGRPGSLGQRGANLIHQNCDFLLVLGARLDSGQTGYNHEHFAPKAQKVVVEIDPCELDKLKMPNMLGVKTDVSVFLKELIQRLKGKEMPNIEEWKGYCTSITQKYPVVQPQYYLETDYVNPYVLIDIISQNLSGDAIIVPGSSGMCSEITLQAFKVKKGQRILNTQGFGAMGFGLPASIAVCIAAGNKPTICVNGDGGFQLNIQELETVARVKLPIKFFILNNQGYGAITNTQRNYFDSFYVASEKTSGLTLPDICKLAEAYGIPSMRVHNNNELQEKMHNILAQEGPFICDIMVNPMQIAQPRMSSMKMDDGTMVSKPLEDLWPFLDSDELAKNMFGGE